MESGNPLSYIYIISGYVFTYPDAKIVLGLILILLLLFGSAVISGSEVAFFSFTPEDLQKLKNDKSKKSQAVIKLYNKPEKLLSTILVANNTINIAIVLLAAYLSSKMFKFNGVNVWGFIINTVVITFLLLFFGEIMPKVYGSRNQVKMAYFMAYPLSWLEKIFTPVTSLLILSTSFIKRRTSSRSTNISMDDLSDALELTTADFSDDEKILKGIVNFGNKNVSAIMCPRIDVTAVDIKTGFDKIITEIINSGFSRIPIYAGTFDSVKGILYAKDVLPYTNNPVGFKWQALLRPPYFVPETKKINDLLKEFQTKKIHMAIVIDEYGGTSGIVTLEDILEEIVGEISDEGDEEQPLFRKINEKTYLFEGKILLNDFYKVFEIEEDIFQGERGESETLAGLILELTGEIPEKGQIIKSGTFTFIIESSDRRRIKEIRVENNKNDGDIEKE